MLMPCVNVYMMLVQMEMKLDASQETIVDQQQTIEKFRELVRGMQGEIGELRAKGEQRAAEDTVPQAQAMMSLQTQLKSSAMKQTSRVSSVCVFVCVISGRQFSEHLCQCERNSVCVL